MVENTFEEASKRVFAENLKVYIAKSGKSINETARELGIPVTTVYDWINAKTYPRIDKLDLLAQYYNITKSELVEKRSESDCEYDILDSRIVFAENLRMQLGKCGKSRQEVSQSIGVSYSTFSEWVNGKKYPRIEKIEVLADYFGVPVSVLVGNKREEAEDESREKDELLDIIIRMRTDTKFRMVIEQLNQLDTKQIAGISNMLQAFLNK